VTYRGQYVQVRVDVAKRFLISRGFREVTIDNVVQWLNRPGSETFDLEEALHRELFRP